MTEEPYVCFCTCTLSDNKYTDNLKKPSQCNKLGGLESMYF